MSRTKEYIDTMFDAGIDVLASEIMDDEYFEQAYVESLKDMNQLFDETITE